ncbi:MAG TPA: 6-bladed beta-propeller [Edaphocola sp.]|nr:6-bladed beta-propeller [Edaphocola sp.]
MRNLIRFFTAIFLVSILPSCNVKKSKDIDKDNQIQKINILSNRGFNIKTSKLISDIKFIPLETTDSILVGDISKIIRTKNEYLILDTQSKSIYAFDMNGKYLRTIGSNGKGPGEYLNPIDFIVDANEDYLFILDELKKIVKTDMNGNLILEKNLPDDFRIIDQIAMYNGFIFASTGRTFYNIDNFEVLQFNESLNLINKHLPYLDPLQFHYSYTNKFFIREGSLFFISLFNYAIYKFVKTDFQLQYTLDFSGKEINLNSLGKSENIFDNKSYAFLFEGCVAGDNLIFLPVFVGGRPYNGFFQPHLNKYTLIKEILNDSYPLIFPSSFYNGYYIATIESFYFRTEFPNENLGISTSDNPIIVEYKLTDNSSAN